MEANVCIPAASRGAPWPFMALVQHAYLHCCLPFDEVLAYVVVVVEIVGILAVVCVT